MYQYYNDKSRDQKAIALPAKRAENMLKTTWTKQDSGMGDVPLFEDMHIHYASGEDCVQAMWKRSNVYTYNVYANETTWKELKRLEIKWEDFGISRESNTPVYLVYLYDRGELYVDGRRIYISDRNIRYVLQEWIRREEPLEGTEEPEKREEPEKQEEPEKREESGEQEESERFRKSEPQGGSEPVEDQEAPQSAEAQKEPEQIEIQERSSEMQEPRWRRYLPLDEDMEYLGRINDMVDFINEGGAALEAAIEDGTVKEEEFLRKVEQRAMELSGKELWQQYESACSGMENLKRYGRKKSPLYMQLQEQRKWYWRALKNLRKPIPSIFEEVWQQEMDSLRRELQSKYEPVMGSKNRQMLESEYRRMSKMMRHKSRFLESEGQAGAEETEAGNAGQTRAGLMGESLMVLPKELPVAGLFPREEDIFMEDAPVEDNEAKESRRKKKFDTLSRHAEELIMKYRLYAGEAGLIPKAQGCVCIMYFKEKVEGGTVYRPAFGISGFFKGKKASMERGFQAMGIPPELLGAADKAAALREYLDRCDALGIRRPSMQACLSYLQTGEDYGGIEKWSPVMCAEPAIVMAVHNLYGHAAELVLSLPFQGTLHQTGDGMTKVPEPKYTCARCALAEKSFGAVVWREEERRFDRERVQMSKEDRRDRLFRETFIRNPNVDDENNTTSHSFDLAYVDRTEESEAAGGVEATEGAGTAEKPKFTPKEPLRKFLKYASEKGFVHGKRRRSLTVTPVLHGALPGYQIRGDNGSLIPAIDPPSTRNNCLFAALQAATGVPLDIDNIRKILRTTLGTERFFREGRMVNDNDLNALRRLSEDQFLEIFHTTGFAIEIYGHSGLLQRTEYGTVSPRTPVLINLGFYHFVARKN